MGSWAQWTARTALLAAGFAAAAGGLSGVALAAAGSGQSPASPCGSAAAVPGDSTAGCVSGALAGVTQPRPATGTRSGSTAAGVIQRAVAPVTSVLGVTGPAGTGSFGSGPLAGLQPMSGLAPLATAPAPRGLAGERVRRTSGNPPGASGAGDTNVPAASQLAGLGALPGLADLPSLAGLANMPARDGVTGGGIPMPGTAMSAANTSGMSSDSFAALAVGALLAGASALKIAGRRARDRKAGFGAMI